MVTMNLQAIYHQPDFPYVDPIDIRHLRFLLRVSRGEKLAKIVLHYGNKYLFGGGHHEIEMKLERSDALFDFYSCLAPLDDQRIGYLFEIVAPDGQSYFLSEKGLSIGFDMAEAYKWYFQFPYVHESDVIHVPSWVHDAVFYQIFPERFRLGNIYKDKSYINVKWGGKVDRASFAGGDLRGIIDSLDYIQGLGVNAIYLNPIFAAATNHAYDTMDYFQIEPRFGTEADLKELIDELHARGMHLVLDAVFNHVSYFSPYFQDVVRQGDDSENAPLFMLHKGTGKPDIKKRNYETFSSAGYMPKIDVDNEKAASYLEKVALHYLELGIDGWRFDVGDEISHRFWKRLRLKIKDRFPEALLIGEIWHRSEMFMRGDEFDGIMNYPLYYTILDYLALRKIDAKETADRLNGISLLYRQSTLPMMYNLIDSHDTARFYTAAGKNLSALESGLALLCFNPGMTSIFYGDELPMEGDRDPDCRRCFPYEEAIKGTDHQELVRKLFALRKGKALSYGTFTAYEKNGLLVVEREFEDQKAALYINGTGSKIDVPFAPYLSVSFDGTALLPSGFAIKLS